MVAGDAPLARSDSLSRESWTVMREQAMVLVKSGFLPRGVDTPEKAMSIVMKGRELGVPPMYALSNIAVINGKPVAGAELMLALIYRDHGDDAIRVVASTNELCTVAYKRRSWQEAEFYSFTIEDAERAGLLGKDNWRHYPAAMLRARCISAVARLAFPDTIGGLYTPEELGARVQVVDRDGEMVVEATDREQPRRSGHPESARSGQRESTRGGRAESYRSGRPAQTTDQAPCDTPTPATPEQLQAIAKLSRLLGEELDPADLDGASARDILTDLSRRYNALEPAERSRRARESRVVR